MRNIRQLANPMITALLAVGVLVPHSAIAATADSEELNGILKSARTEAADLSRDSGDMESFTRTRHTWESYASKVEMIKQHINTTGKLLAQMKDAENAGSHWQQQAIKRIEPLLKELAANTAATIGYLNDNKSKVHLPEFRDYVRANSELAANLESLIRDFVNYGEARQKYERLGGKLEVTE
jgi:hypothetical protein